MDTNRILITRSITATPSIPINPSNIVISVGLFGHSGDKEVWDGMDEDTLSKTKIMLDDMHKRKIDMADAIYVINVGGYIGDSTKSEIEYAKAHGKEVRYLEPEA